MLQIFLGQNPTLQQKFLARCQGFSFSISFRYVGCPAGKYHNYLSLEIYDGDDVMKKTLKTLRREIDQIDQELIKLLAKRFKVTQKIGIYKKEYNLPPQDKKREKQLFKERKQWAEKEGLNIKLIEKIFKLIIEKVRQDHKKLQ